ncbi:hypothetical protein N7520_005100 [Penicillium odoratum]|uniref:uncharacterized protein n=1 Tax=Penicillium odoratum TaxID=1167516 RepID=UPI002547A2AE|nr:uncharacterized protein N7520_005100 [Penicillium odoratum]KAJ5765541.1 hypothetical protein N7520_005100 [Penicillium odoratum]
MAFQPTPADISVLITNAAFSRTADSEPRFVTERRVTPTWTVMQLKGKLETMTGVPPGSQRLLVKVPGRSDQWADDDDRAIGDWGLVKGTEIVVHDSRPQAMRPNFTDLSSVEKYELPTETYESLPNSVLAWKKNLKLGRFDPNALSPEESLRHQVAKDKTEIVSRVSGPGRELEKEGELPVELQPIWVGVELDEPTGKNDGSVNGQRYFECLEKRGAFVKPDKLEVGDFPPLGLDDDLDDLMEEI